MRWRAFLSSKSSSSKAGNVLASRPAGHGAPFAFSAALNGRAPSRNPGTVISVSNLRIQREIVILEAIDWAVQRGEHWVILGANGSGKTSLLSALTGYTPPTAGEISVLGEKYGKSDWRELRKRVGVVSSSIYQLMEGHQTALDAIVGGRHAVIGKWGQVSAAEMRQAEKLLRMIEAESIRNRPWRVLSQGERQRVLIGRALMARPELLILDEPCAGLDPVARERFLQFLGRLMQLPNTPTLVLVTHHVEEIIPPFSHVLLLRKGTVVAAGPKSKILTSRLLSRVFDASVQLRHQRGRYSMAVSASAGVVV